MGQPYDQEYLAAPLPDADTQDIRGNATRQAKEWAVKWHRLLRRLGHGYAWDVASRIAVKEVWFQGHQDTSMKKEVRMVSQLNVAQDMCDVDGNLDKGCMSMLIDESSAIALILHNAIEGSPNIIAVSQSINFSFHASAALGTKLRIVSRSVTTGGTIDTTRSEIWDDGNHRLVASGVQNQASRSKW
ncbi:hypothetical protein FA15DRAFT_753028 [Coprinopsis marcescibilis]|uniref:Thioesterase domain-containing protein n=1 Tax=Coprinopsis marcescibilis TaxID=230819 RepID=A0A5C3L878_COPMA|nr:hypothetical protein FA15DRAFT_753028 [Coprinopsis marcescibilis]